MIIVCRYNSTDLSAVKDLFAYEIAGIKVLSSEKIASLTAFSVDSNNRVLDDFVLVEAHLLCDKKRHLHYQGVAQFNQKLREIDFWRCDDMAQIDIDGVPICVVDLKAQRIIVFNDSAFDSSLNLEVITGPALIMLLIQQGIYCLHAGAVSISDVRGLNAKNIVFLGDSGAGKSTLSTHVGEQWCQLSDDILPVSHIRRFIFHDDFPQLKLPNARPQTPSLDGGNASLDCIVLLDQQPSEEIALQRLAKPQALLSIIRHTVAIRLFDSTQTKQHLLFAKSLVDCLPVLSVTYPRDIRQLSMLQSAISDSVFEVCASAN